LAPPESTLRSTMIEIIPSISILNGKVTRLKQGDYSHETVYKQSPVDIAKKFEDFGIKKIHIVDLDGAKKGSPINYHALESVANYTSLQIDFSGGIATDGDISKAYEYGADTITAASVAVQNQKLFASWLISYGREKMTLGADTNNMKIAISGWQKSTEIDVLDHIDYFFMRGLKYVKSTDIDKDGIQEGPNFELCEKIVKRFPDISLIASGGVRSVDDIKRLDDIGVKGVMFGRAYYEGNLKLTDLKDLI